MIQFDDRWPGAGTRIRATTKDGRVAEGWWTHALSVALYLDMYGLVTFDRAADAKEAERLARNSPGEVYFAPLNDMYEWEAIL